jgi:hypothetical protein
MRDFVNGLQKIASSGRSTGLNGVMDQPPVSAERAKLTGGGFCEVIL